MKKNPLKQTSPITVEISTPKCPFTRRGLEVFIRKVLNLIRKNLFGVNLFVVDSSKMKRLHKKFFNDPSDTDCISFSQLEGLPMNGERLLGDVFVCWNQVRRQARKFGNTPREELLYCIIHGLLHLIGHDDHQPRKRAKMFKLQDRIFKRLRDGHTKD